MRCPHCGMEESRVVDSRPAEAGKSVRRRRACVSCDARFTTYERIDTTPLAVIKKDGSREQFDRDKLLKGILTACEKRSIASERIQKLVNEVVRALLARSEPEVFSAVIGEEVMGHLRELDEVAYVRFASVYRSFKDAEAFEEAVRNLKTDKTSTDEGGSDV